MSGDEIYMIRKKPKNPKYEEIHGFYRAAYGEAITITSGDDAIIWDD